MAKSPTTDTWKTRHQIMPGADYKVIITTPSGKKITTLIQGRGVSTSCFDGRERPFQKTPADAHREAMEGELQTVWPDGRRVTAEMVGIRTSGLTFTWVRGSDALTVEGTPR